MTYNIYDIQGVLKKVYPTYDVHIRKKNEINSNKIFTVVRIFHCLHLEVFTD